MGDSTVLVVVLIGLAVGLDYSLCYIRRERAERRARAAPEAALRAASAVLVLFQHVEPAYSHELLSAGESGVGYLLKQRVSEVCTFLDAVRRVAAGGTALDREVVSSLIRSRDGTTTGDGARLDALTPRERDPRAHRPKAHERCDCPRAGRRPGRRGEARLARPVTIGQHGDRLHGPAAPSSSPALPELGR